ncbi:MAG: hypothetical protein ACK46X_06265 [Candidatus Sericytochromatia bacterium]
MITRRWLPLTAAVAALAGCAWGPGAGFATLQKAVTTQALSLSPDRVDETGRWKTDNGYRLTVSEGIVRVFVAAVTLEETGESGAGNTAGASAAFDPANPPPGYSLCHGGHCHRADGALIDYADIQASLAGGTVQTTRTLMALVPTTKVAFVPLGGEASLTSFNCRLGVDGACDFGEGVAETATLQVERLQAYGRAAAGPGLGLGDLGTGSVEWVLDLDQESQPSKLQANMGPRVIDRLGPADLRFTGRLQVTERLFDGIDWDRLAKAANGATLKLETDEVTRERILSNLAKSSWSAELAP